MNNLEDKWVVRTHQNWFLNEKLGTTRVLRDQPPISIFTLEAAKLIQICGYAYTHLTRTVIIPLSEAINEENEIMPARVKSEIDTAILGVWVRVGFTAWPQEREVEQTSYEIMEESYDDDGDLWTAEMMSEFVTNNQDVSDDLDRECLDAI